MVPIHPTRIAVSEKAAVSMPICRATGHEMAYPSEIGPVDPPGKEGTAVRPVPPHGEKRRHKGKTHHHARQKRGYSGSQQTEFGQPERTVDEQIVAHYVEHIAAYEHIHRHLGVADAVIKLLETVENAHERQRCNADKPVGTHQRKQLFGLSEAVYVGINGHEHGHNYGGEHKVGGKCVAHNGAYAPRIPAPEELPDDGCQPVREAQSEDNEQHEERIDETGGGQLGHTVAPDHDCVGKTEHDSAQLSHDYGQSQGHKRPVMGHITVDERLHKRMQR